MLIAELKKELIVKGIPSKWYSINDFIIEDGYNFREIHNAYWEIFYMDEKGNQKNYRQFNDEADACEYLLDLLLKRKNNFEEWKKNCNLNSIIKQKDLSNLNNINSVFYVSPNGNIKI